MNKINYFQVLNNYHCLLCHKDYNSKHSEHKCEKENEKATPCNEKCDPKWNIKGVNDVPPSSDSWDIRTEINTRLWYAHGAITPTSEEMERMVTSMEALLLSQEVRIKKEMRERVEKLREEVMPTHAVENAYGCALDDLLTYLK